MSKGHLSHMLRSNTVRAQGSFGTYVITTFWTCVWFCFVFFFGQWKMFEPESGSEKEEAPDVGRAKNGPRSVIPNLFWLVTLCWRHKFLATPDTFFFFQSRDCSQSGCTSSDFVICCILLELEVYVHERARIQLFKIVSGVINNNFNIYNI